MEKKTEIRAEVDAALVELETLADEVRLKLHLANMDARDAWNRLEPKLDDAKRHGREASEASKRVVSDAVAALRSLAQSL